jgi:hypothetical protein
MKYTTRTAAPGKKKTHDTQVQIIQRTNSTTPKRTQSTLPLYTEETVVVPELTPVVPTSYLTQCVF